VRMHEGGNDAEPTIHVREVVHFSSTFNASVHGELLTCPAPSLTRQGLLISLFERN
jgi:hypothetical protein